jgi:hypothetical protein
MKRNALYLTAAGLVIASVSFAQVSFGIRAGVNFQNIIGKDYTGEKLEYDLLTGFHAGVNAEIPVAQEFYVRPGLLFSTKGAKEREGDYEAIIKVAYIELPVHLVYKPEFGDGNLILGLGPYVAYGTYGKVKGEYDGETDETDIRFKNKLTEEEMMDENFYIKRFDAGVDIFFGYEFAFRLSVQLNGQMGLLDLDPGYDGDEHDESSPKNAGFGLSVGYRF